MRKILKLGILSVLSGCMQPGNIEIVKSSATPQVIAASNKPQAQVNANVDTNTTIKQPEGSLISKGNEPSAVVVSVSPTPIVTTTPTASPTPFYYTNTPGYPTSTSPNNQPINTNQNKPFTPCDAYGQASSQCVAYIESQRPPKPFYSNNYPVPENVRSGEVSVIFKDEYRVRVKKELSDNPNTYEFNLVAQSGQSDLEKVKQILLEYSIKQLAGGNLLTEEDANEFERKSEIGCQCDSRNLLSSYYVFPENQNIKEMVEKLRANPIVREANYLGRLETGAASIGYTP